MSFAQAPDGRLQCLALVGLMFRVYEACAPPTSAYGCEIWGFQRFPQQVRILRKDLVTSHLQMLKEITGVRSSTSTNILLAECIMSGYCGLSTSGHAGALHWTAVGMLWGHPKFEAQLGIIHVLSHPCYRGERERERNSRPGLSLEFDLLTWMSLIFLPYGSTV